MQQLTPNMWSRDVRTELNQEESGADKESMSADTESVHTQQHNTTTVQQTPQRVNALIKPHNKHLIKQTEHTSQFSEGSKVHNFNKTPIQYSTSVLPQQPKRGSSHCNPPTKRQGSNTKAQDGSKQSGVC